jgi:hypothetical protein
MCKRMVTIAIARMGISASASSKADPRVPWGHLTIMMGTVRLT